MSFYSKSVSLIFIIQLFGCYPYAHFDEGLVYTDEEAVSTSQHLPDGFIPPSGDVLVIPSYRKEHAYGVDGASRNVIENYFGDYKIISVQELNEGGYTIGGDRTIAVIMFFPLFGVNASNKELVGIHIISESGAIVWACITICYNEEKGNFNCLSPVEYAQIGPKWKHELIETFKKRKSCSWHGLVPFDAELLKLRKEDFLWKNLGSSSYDIPYSSSQRKEIITFLESIRTLRHDYYSIPTEKWIP